MPTDFLMNEKVSAAPRVVAAMVANAIFFPILERVDEMVFPDASVVAAAAAIAASSCLAFPSMTTDSLTS